MATFNVFNVLYWCSGFYAGFIGAKFYASTTSAGTPSALYRLRAMSKLIDLRP